MATSKKIDMIENGAASSNEFIWPGGIGSFMVVGTWGGATISLQYKAPDGSTFVDVGTDTTLTANGGGNFELPSCVIKATVSGGPPSGVYASVIGVG